MGETLLSMGCIVSLLYVFYQGLVDQVGEDQRLGCHTYLPDLSVRLFPRRVKIDVSDPNAGRSWSLENYLFGSRSAGSAEDAAFPADKQWASYMFKEYRGDLTSARQTVEKPLLMITADLALSRHPPTPRSHGQNIKPLMFGSRHVLPLYWQLGIYRLVANCMASSKTRNSIVAHGTRKDHGKLGTIGERVVARRNPIMVMPRRLIAPRTRVARRNIPRLSTAIPNPRSRLPNLNPRWICDQGCCIADDWEEDVPSKPINRSRAPHVKRWRKSRWRMASMISRVGNCPLPKLGRCSVLDDQNTPDAMDPTIGRDASIPSRLRIRRRTL